MKITGICPFNVLCLKSPTVLVLTFTLTLTLAYLSVLQPWKPKLQPMKHILKEKVTHIRFLKVHKCGSGTMAHIFYRFGLMNNLTFALTRKGIYVKSVASLLSVKPIRHYDILASHSFYSRELFYSIFATDPVFIAIIREPALRMISAAFFYRDVARTKYLLQVPRKHFIEQLIQFSHVYDRQPFSYTKNSMGRDFGFSSSISINDTEEIEEHIDMLKKDFKLVMIQEKFDESLILMRRLLNWDIEDIIYTKMNENMHEHVTLTDNLTKKLHKTCFLDYKIYQTFIEIFNEKVKAGGPELSREVEWFKYILQSVNRFCDAKQVNKTLTIQKSEWNEPFIITQAKCTFLKMVGSELMPMLRKRHIKMNS